MHSLLPWNKKLARVQKDSANEVTEKNNHIRDTHKHRRTQEIVTAVGVVTGSFCRTVS